jgi:hypothetical protein
MSSTMKFGGLFVSVSLMLACEGDPVGHALGWYPDPTGGVTGTGGATGAGGTSSGGTTTTTTQSDGTPNVQLSGLILDIPTPNPCQPFNILWEYANKGSAPAPAPVGAINVPHLTVYRFTTDLFEVDKEYPWSNNLAPHVDGSTTGLDEKSHNMETGLDPRPGNDGSLNDGAGWDIGVSPITTVAYIANPIHRTIVDVDSQCK